MVEIPDETVARYLITAALEFGEWERRVSKAAEGPYGQAEFDLEWSLSDLSPSDCDVDMLDETTVLLTGQVEGHYSVRVSRASRHHPAEYRTERVKIFVSIEADFADGFPQITITSER